MRDRRIVALFIGVLVVAGVWALLAPRQIGGSLTYVSVSGSSMEPALRAGDLAMVRGSDRYAVGDVVAYRSPSLGSIVLHRIVEQRGDRFVLRGDANRVEDVDRPRADDILGSLWVRVPGAGSLLGIVRSPFGLGLLAFAGLMGLVRRAGRAPHAVARTTAIAAPAAIALAALAATVVSFVMPVSRVMPERLDVHHEASITTLGTVEPSAAYPDGMVSTDDPIYLQLVSTLTVAANYRFDVAGTYRLRGSGRLVGVLDDGAGWERRIALTDVVPFEGRSAHLEGELDLDGLRSLTRAVGELTGVRPPSYGLQLQAEIAIDGVVEGEAFSDEVTLGSRFTLEPLMLVPDEAEDPRSFAFVDVPRARPTRVGIGAARIDVATLRVLAPIVLLIALLGVGLARRRAPEAAEQLPWRHAATLVHVEPLTQGPVVEVASLDALVRLADHTGHVLLAERADEPSFALQHEGTTYRYAGSRNGHA